MDHTLRKITTFGVVFVIFFLSGLFLNSGAITWVSHSSLPHSFLQSVATVLAFFVGSGALYRFYSEQSGNYMLLFIGVGFMGTTVIDAYHTIVTASWFLKTFPNIPHTAVEWSWLSTRTFLAALLIFSLIGVYRDKTAGPVNPKPIYIGVTILTFLILVVFILVSVPLPTYPDRYITHPLELIPGFLFVIALIGYLAKGNWKTDKFEYWIVLFLITSVASQFFYIDLSHKPHDILYIGAHVLKIISYGMVYLGVTSKNL
jgi:hypothetical protein